jgi:hypothetical protein
VTRQQDFWPPLYGWGSPVREDSYARMPTLYSRRTHGPLGYWWAETRAEWRAWWASVTNP